LITIEKLDLIARRYQMSIEENKKIVLGLFEALIKEIIAGG